MCSWSWAKGHMFMRHARGQLRTRVNNWTTFWRQKLDKIFSARFSLKNALKMCGIVSWDFVCLTEAEKNKKYNRIWLRHAGQTWTNLLEKNLTFSGRNCAKKFSDKTFKTFTMLTETYSFKLWFVEEGRKLKNMPKRQGKLTFKGPRRQSANTESYSGTYSKIHEKNNKKTQMIYLTTLCWRLQDHLFFTLGWLLQRKWRQRSEERRRW